MDDRSEAAEGDLPSTLDHLLDDLDEDGDADGVDDLGVAQVQEEVVDALVHQLVGDAGDLLAADVVDVTLRVQDCARFPAALDPESQFVRHCVFPYFTM